MPYVAPKMPNLGDSTIITKKFRDIRGVDFSTQSPKDSRSPDMTGMYRDWEVDGRNCIVMMPGFRVIGDIGNLTTTTSSIDEETGEEVINTAPADITDSKILGVHFFKAVIDVEDSAENPIETEEPPEMEKETSSPAEDEETEPKEPTKPKTHRESVEKVLIHSNNALYEWLNFYECEAAENSQDVPPAEFKLLFEGMSIENKSQSIVFDNKLFLIDGLNYLVYDGISAVPVALSEDIFTPTTYISRNYAGGGVAYQPKNLINPKFKNSAFGDEKNKEFQLSELDLYEVIEIKINDEVITEDKYSVDLEAGKVTFETAPPKPASIDTDNIEFTILKYSDENMELITKNRVITVFNNYAVLTGHPDNYNDVRWCRLDDPTYWVGVDYVVLGKGKSPVVNLIKVGNNQLCAIKADTQQDGVVYYLTIQDMDSDEMPINFSSTSGVAGNGAISHFGAVTLRDDPCFLSSDGLSAIGKLSIGFERSIEHRSTFVDRKLKSESYMEKAVVTEWRGYLVALFPSGNMYLADSRMKPEMVDSQSIEYDWFFISDIGIYEGQQSFQVDVNTEKTITELQNDVNLAKTDEEREIARTAIERAIIVNEMRGGIFSPPTTAFEHKNQLYFATESGKICKFNTDVVRDDGSKEPKSYAYNNNGRKINAYYCTPFHDFEALNMLKKFDKKGNVLHTKSFKSSWIRYAIITNKSYWREAPKINNGYFDYSDLNYSDYSYNTYDQPSFFLKKLKEKKWQFAQIKISNARINSAFGIYEMNLRVKYQKPIKK